MHLSEVGKIHLCGPISENLTAKFKVIERGILNVKGKGEILTHWIHWTNENENP